MALSAVTVAVSLNPAVANADPTPPANEQDAQKQVEQQTAQADQIGQQYLAAKDDLAAKQADVASATADIDKYGKQLTDARAKEEQFRGQVDQVAAAAFDGAQFTVGRAVSLDSLIPGDLIFYGSSASNIHHVSMYVGAGKVVHAPTEGEVVKIVPIGNSGSDIFGAKRIVG